MATSPPSTTAPPPASYDPISPVSRSTTFPHTTSGAVISSTPLISTNTPAINAAPVELDGVATSPENLRRRATGEAPVANVSTTSLRSPADEEDIDGEFLGEGGDAGRRVREVC